MLLILYNTYILQDKIDGCCKLISELASGGHGNQSNKPKFGSIPCSPKGVVDVSYVQLRQL
jgi:cyclin D3